MTIKSKKRVEYLGWLLFFETHTNEPLHHGRISASKVYSWVLIRNNGFLKDLRKRNLALKLTLPKKTIKNNYIFKKECCLHCWNRSLFLSVFSLGCKRVGITFHYLYEIIVVLKHQVHVFAVQSFCSHEFSFDNHKYLCAQVARDSFE